MITIRLAKISRTLGWALACVSLALGSAIESTAAPGDTFVIVANKTYGSGMPAVEFADRDGDAVEKAATDSKLLNIPLTGIKRFNDMTQGDAQQWFQADGVPGQELVEHIRRAAGTRKDATIYFYYTGHGISAKNALRGEDELHLVLRDTRTNAIGSTGLSITAVKLALARVQKDIVPQGRVVLLLDACFSGVDRDGRQLWEGARMIGPTAKAKAVTVDRMVMLGASSSNEPAWSDPARQHGAFTDALLDGLYGKAAQADGRITAESLHQFVSMRVNERLARVKRSQTPSLDGDATTQIAALNKPFPMRDPDAGPRVIRQCVIMREEADLKKVENFLNTTCLEDCPCRDDLTARMSQNAACRGEAADVDEVIAKGPVARRQLLALQAHLSCAAVKAKVDETLSVWDGGKSAADAQAAADAKRAADLKAADDARRAVEDARAKADAERQTALRMCTETLTNATGDKLRGYLALFPNGICAEEVRMKLAAITPPPQPQPQPQTRPNDAVHVPAPPRAPANKCGWFAVFECAETGDPGGRGYLIRTDDFPNFRAGWNCRVLGPFDSSTDARSAAQSGGGYAKKGC